MTLRPTKTEPQNAPAEVLFYGPEPGRFFDAKTDAIFDAIFLRFVAIFSLAKSK
jgi:hypothetical protein